MIVLWSLKAKVHSVESDPYNNTFACAVIQGQKGCVFIFEPSSPIPLQTIAMEYRPYGIAFLRSATGKASFVYLDKNCELHRFTVEDEVKPKVTLPRLEQALFTSMYGKGTDQQTGQISHVEKVDPDTLQFLDIPAHILPTPGKIAENFLKGFLRERARPEAQPNQLETSTAVDTVMETTLEPVPIIELSVLDDALRDLFVSTTSPDAGLADKEELVYVDQHKGTFNQVKRDQKKTLVDRNGKETDQRLSKVVTESRGSKQLRTPKTPTQQNTKKRSVPNT
jgi:hypothetical protein